MAEEKTSLKPSKRRMQFSLQLEFIDLRFTQATAAGVERLRKALPRAKVLRLNDAE